MAIADILLTGATVWHAPVGEALPADSTAYGAALGGNWVSVGYTTSPLTLSIDRELYEVMVEQLSTPVKRSVVKDSAVFESTLAEFTGENLALAFNGGTVTPTSAGAEQVAKTELEWGGSTSLDSYAWCFEGEYKDASNNSFPVRIFVYTGECVLNGQLSFAKNKEAGIPIQITCQPDTTKDTGKQILKIQKVTGAATGSS